MNRLSGGASTASSRSISTIEKPISARASSNIARYVPEQLRHDRERLDDGQLADVLRPLGGIGTDADALPGERHVDEVELRGAAELERRRRHHRHHLGESG